ncbi:MAG: fibronectin type III domain-containing protein [Treponema sp.]|nr:fibronectin type III domain-containing protein [Treponema sp.]
MKNTIKGIGRGGKNTAINKLWSLLCKLQVLKLASLLILITACATFGIGDPLPPPENVRLTQTVVPRAITVTWNAVEEATEYEVQVVGVGRWTTKETAFTTPSNVTIAPDRNYEVRVTANKKAITGEQSPAVAIRTSPATPVERLPVPSNVTVTANAWNSVTITWGASAGATGYRITQGSNTWTVRGTTHTINDLNGDTNYSFVVTPLLNNDAGTSARAASVRTPLSPQQQATADQRARDQAAAAEREREAQAAETARIASLNSNINFQRLRGEWTAPAGNDGIARTLIFPNDAGSDVSFQSTGTPIRGRLQTITPNHVSVGDSRSGYSFNYSISGNTLTITNFQLRAVGITQAVNVNNVTYTKR